MRSSETFLFFFSAFPSQNDNSYPTSVPKERRADIPHVSNKQQRGQSCEREMGGQITIL